MTAFSLFQKVDVARKVAQAPDESYELGLVIGSYLPFVVLVGFAYWMYYRAKKRDENR
ncbi:MAG: hypothetical protein ACRC6O_02780 [Flavobacterium sp.]